MIIFFTITVLLVTGLQCKVIPDESPAPVSPEERTVDKSDNAENKASNSMDTQQYSKEAATERKETTEQAETKAETEQITAKSETGGDPKVDSTAESAVSERHERSPKENSEVSRNDESRLANVDDEIEKSVDFVKSGPLNSNCKECSQSFVNPMDKFNDSSQLKSQSDIYASAEVELKSGSIETETAERDDASHIDIKETRRGPIEENIEVPSSRVASDEDHKPESVENEDSKSASDESKDVLESQLRTAKQDDENRSSMEAEDDARSGLLSDVGIEALVRSDIDLPNFNPGTSLRILDQKYHIQDNIPDLLETADTRMAPREYTSPIGQHNPFGGASRWRGADGGARGGNFESDHSEYPYSPLEKPSPDDISSVLPSFSETSLLTRKSLTSSQNFKENTIELPSLPPVIPLPPFPPPEPIRPFKPLPPHQPLNPFEPRGSIQYFERSGPFEPQRVLPPLEGFTTFKPLPPLRPFVANRPFEPLPPLPQLEPFKPMPPLEPLKPFPPLRPLDFNRHFEPLPLQDQPVFFNTLPRLKLLQAQQASPNLYSNFRLQPFYTMTPSPSIISMSRQAPPEASSRNSEGFSRTWHSALLTPNTAVSLSSSSSIL